MDNGNEERDQIRRALEPALEKAKYEASRSRRQYDAADPENRLVAAELESRWNTALVQVAELEIHTVDRSAKGRSRTAITPLR